MRATALILASLPLLACDDEQRPVFANDGGAIELGGVGDPCESDIQCRGGLHCSDGTCQPDGMTMACGGCTLTAECMENFACAPNIGACPAGCVDDSGTATCDPFALGYCVPRGDAAQGELCSSDVECDDGLYCQLIGLAGTCQPTGTGDWGDPCTSTGDCLAGLWCDVADGVCAPPFMSFDPFPGVECLEDMGDFRVYFEVATENDFFRLPFPNDAAVAEDGTVDLSTFPTPGPGFLGVDILREYFDRIGAEFSGFSPMAAVYFRFSGDVDFDSLRGDDATDPVRLVDVTEGDADFGQITNAFSWVAWASARKYICQNWVALLPMRPLREGHRYAAILTTDVRAADGGLAAVQDADFAAMLADSDPGEGLTSAWNAYAPLRAYLATTTDITTSQIAGAAVFTVSVPTTLVERLGNVVRTAGPTPTIGDVRACTATAEAADRACACAGGEVNPAFTEIHGQITLPVVQAGTRPYLTTDDGGAVELDGTGNPVVQTTEAACFSLAVPAGAVSPLPVVVYAHGTGGNFRSGMADVAETLAGVGIATFAWTGVLHDERRGAGEGSDLEPDLLIFNLMNPEAARGNLAQGAADLFQVVRTLAGTSIDPGTGPITFDPTRVYFFGHSQGSTTGGLAVPFDAGIPVAVLSGAGGSLVDSLLNKTSPFDLSAAVDFVLQESADRYHPALNLLQTYVDPVDLVEFGHAYFERPHAGFAPRHVLMTYGVSATKGGGPGDDTYSPPATLAAFARALRAAPVNPVLDDFNGPEPVNAPVTGNYAPSDPNVTAVVVQVDSMGAYDGHFVAFDDDTLRGRWAAFLQSYAVGVAPTLP